MTSIQTLAGDLYRAFEAKTRDNGDTFYCLKSGSPGWMEDAIRAAHNDAAMLPDDWRFAAIREAAGAIEDAEDLADAGDQFADNVDVYNGELLAWVASRLSRMDYCDEAMEEFGKPDSMTALLQWGQMAERREVFDQLAAFLGGMASDDEAGQ